MPTYQYECEACGIRFERREKMTAEPLKVCPECDGAVHRVIQPVGVIFKGSGWYCKDHNSSSNLTSTAKNKPEEKDTPPPSEKKSSEDK